MKLVWSVALIGAAYASPVEKVVTLLEDLQTKIEADGEAEQKMYNKFACWCEKTTGRKAAAITTARTELQKLGSTILATKGTIATRTSEIKGLLTSIADNEDAQKTATAIREKENTNYMAEKAEMQQALAALEKAIMVLKANSFVENSKLMKRVHAAVKLASRYHDFNPQQLEALQQFSHGRQAYAPQSATIQGILSDMYSTFAKNMQTADTDEAKLHRNFEDLMAVKHQQLVTFQDTLQQKQQEKAESETILADATQNYAETEEQVKLDIKFFDATKQSCTDKTSAWSTRQSLRTEEIQGITQAIGILSTDDAKKLFSSAIKAGVGTGTFLQFQSELTLSSPVSKAFQTLELHARSAHSLRLAALASSVRMSARALKSGHFDSIIKKIEDLISDLQVDQADDDKKVDDCQQQMHNLTSEIEDLSWKVEKKTARIQKLNEAVSRAETEKTETIKEKTDLGKTMQKMNETRTSENTAFKTNKDDDTKAIGLLQDATAALKKYYEQNALLQLSNLTDPDVAPDATFSSKHSRRGESQGIISLLTLIIEDLQEEVKSSTAAEAAAQLDYEKRLADAQAIETNLQNKIDTLAQQITDKNADIVVQQKALDNDAGTKTAKEKTKSDVKPDCDWYIKNQAERRSKRATEMDGLVAAKEYLAGARPAVGLTSLKQSRFDDKAFGRISFGAVSFLQKRA